MMNLAEPKVGQVIRFAAPGLAHTLTPPSWVEPAIRTGSFEIALRVRAFERQPGLIARILSLSKSVYSGNLVIAQDGNDLIVRLRVPGTDLGGKFAKGRPVLRVDGVFASSDWQDIRLQVTPERAAILIDDQPMGQAPLDENALAEWERNLLLTLGNEISANRPWLGEIARAEVEAGDFGVDYVDDDGLIYPPEFVFMRTTPKLVPLIGLNREDAANNIIMYVPWGLLIGLGLGTRSRRRVVFLTALPMALSITMESGQLLFADRNPSVDDVIFNTLGGVLGISLAMVFRRAERHVATQRSRSWSRSA